MYEQAFISSSYSLSSSGPIVRASTQDAEGLVFSITKTKVNYHWIDGGFSPCGADALSATITDFQTVTSWHLDWTSFYYSGTELSHEVSAFLTCNEDEGHCIDHEGGLMVACTTEAVKNHLLTNYGDHLASVSADVSAVAIHDNPEHRIREWSDHDKTSEGLGSIVCAGNSKDCQEPKNVELPMTIEVKEYQSIVSGH